MNKTTIFPNFFYTTPETLSWFIEKIGLDPTLLDEVDPSERGLVFTDAWLAKLLPSLTTDQHTQVADEILMKMPIITPHIKTYHKLSKPEKVGAAQLEQLYWRRIFEILQKYNITPSSKSYSLVHNNVYNKQLITAYFQMLHDTMVPLVSQSEDASNTWNILMAHIMHNDFRAAAQWLIDHEIYPQCEGVKSQSENRHRPDDTVFSWVRHTHGVDFLKKFPKALLTPYVNHTNALGRAPMHHAVAALLPDMVDYLVELGAHKSPQDKKGKYPLDVIRKTTHRVEHIAHIRNTLGKATSKNTQELLTDAIVKFDSSLMESALKDPQILQKAPPILFEVLGHMIENGTPIVYNKIRVRKLELFRVLIAYTPLCSKNEHGDTLLHAAIQSGLLPAIEYLLQQKPELTQMRNASGRLAADIVVEEFDKIISNSSGVCRAYSEIKQDMQIDTSKKILALFQQYNIELKNTNFPSLWADEEWCSMLSKQRLLKALDSGLSFDNPKSKI